MPASSGNVDAHALSLALRRDGMMRVSTACPLVLLLLFLAQQCWLCGCRSLQSLDPDSVITPWPLVAALINATAADPPADLLQNCYASKRQFDIVVSHYKEDANDIRRKVASIVAHPKVAPLSPCVTIYTKGTPPQDLQQQIPWAHVEPLENVGRESHTWVHHILVNYQDLPAHMLFIQGGLEHFSNVIRKLSAFSPSTGFMCMAYWGRSTCEGGELRPDKRMREVWAMTRTDFCFEDFTICYRGQFLVSAARVKHHPAALYQRLRSLLGLPTGHVIHKDGPNLETGEKIWPWGPSNPLLGHTMERAWTFMFNCHAPSKQPAKTLAQTHGTRLCQCYEAHPVGAVQVGQPGGQCSYTAMANACQCLDRLHHSRPQTQ